MLRLLFALVVVGTLTTAGCGPEYDSCFRSRGGTVTLTRQLGPGFHSVVADGPLDLQLVYDTAAAGTVTLTGGENLLEFVHTELKDSVLYLDVNTRCNWARNLRERYAVRVALPPLKALSITGTVRATTPDSAYICTQGEAQCSIAGTEDQQLRFGQSAMVVMEHSGLGNVTLTGSIGVFVAVVLDAGSLDARNCANGYSYVYHYGIGDCWVWAEKAMGLVNFNRGTIYYGGQPWEAPTLDQKSSGPIVRYD